MGNLIKIAIVFISLSNVQIKAQCWESVFTGYYQTMAINMDGTLWAWGDNLYHQLGDGTMVDRYAPTQVSTSNNWKVIAPNFSHTLAIKTDGTLWAWGLNEYGQLGDGTTSIRSSPIQIGTDTNWQSVSTENNSLSIAIKTDGTLWAWGINEYGAFGNGTTNTSSHVPIQIGTETNWQSITAAGKHALAIKTDGTLWAWGLNSNYQFGDSTMNNSVVPIQIGTDANWENVSAGVYHSVALKTDGTLWAWGDNLFGALGDGTTILRRVPTQIGTETNWKSVKAGQYYTLALKTDGTVWAWGYNNYGQLGDGTLQNDSIPKQVGTSTDNLSIDTRFGHAVVLKINRTLWSWGFNLHGEVGDGTTIDKFNPTQIGTTCLASIEELTNSELFFDLYPNPTNLNAYLAVNRFGNEPVFIEVMDITGKVQEVNIEQVQKDLYNLQISGLAKGIYFVKLTSLHETKTKQLIVN